MRSPGAWRLREHNGPALPAFDEFWERGVVEIDDAERGHVLYAEFREDPGGKPLGTPSGRIEIFSETIAGFGYDDCPGHPTWLEPEEWLGAGLAERYSLLLVANNPKTRLHGQLDMGPYSRSEKVQEREPVRIHPDDAAARGLHHGDVVRVFNDRGACLAGVVIDDAVRPRVVQLTTGAWYDPLEPATRIRCACTATQTCLPPTAGHPSLDRAARVSTLWSKSSAGPAHCRPSAPLTRPRSPHAKGPDARLSECPKICRPERVIKRCLGCVRKPGPRLDVLSWGLR